MSTHERPGLARLFFSFLVLGMTAFGGPAMVPFIRRMAVKRRGWITAESFDLGVATAQFLPGATAMQVAAYVGYRVRGVGGAVAAYLGFGLPAFGLMLGLSAIYFHARDAALAEAAFRGFKAVVTALVLSSALDFARSYLRSPLAAALALVAGVAFFLGGNPILILLAVCAVAALAFPREAARGDAVAEPEPAAAVPGGAWSHVGPALQVAAAPLAVLALLAWLRPDLFSLAVLMAKIDCFAFGGGYVSLPLMLHEVTSRGIMGEAMFMDAVALGQITPGPIIITAAFVGYWMSGVLGAAVGAAFVFTPSLLLLLLAVPWADRLSRSAVARRVLAGSLVTLVGLMAAIGLRFGLAVAWGPAEIFVGVGALLALRLRVNVLWVVGGGGLVSVLAALV
jgi:chromate transporter